MILLYFLACGFSPNRVGDTSKIFSFHCLDINVTLARSQEKQNNVISENYTVGLSLTQNDDSPALQITQKVSSNQKLNPQG